MAIGRTANTVEAVAGSDAVARNAGSRDISAADLAAVEVGLQHVTVGGSHDCLIDAGMTTMDIKTSGGLGLYMDAENVYSGCEAGRTFVTCMAKLREVLGPIIAM